MFNNPYAEMFKKSNTEKSEMKKITIEISEDELSKIAGNSVALTGSSLETAINNAIEKMIEEVQSPLLVRIVESLDYPAIVSDVQDQLNYEKIGDYVAENIDTMNLAEEVMEHLDYSDIADKLDYYEVASNISSDSILENLDFYVVAKNLLDEYNPENNCRTGKAFTVAITNAIQYIFKDIATYDYEMKEAIKNIVKIGLEEIDLEKESLKVKNQLLHEEVVKMKQMIEDLKTNFGNTNLL